MIRARLPSYSSRRPLAPPEKFYNGDRILVSKFAFDFTPPKRWDVIVFKYPEDAKTNYIKRLIGLPNEVIRIRDGDIAISKDGGKTFGSAPRDPAKLRAMLQVVYDNDYVFAPLLAAGWPARWHNGAWFGRESLEQCQNVGRRCRPESFRHGRQVAADCTGCHPCGWANRKTKVSRSIGCAIRITFRSNKIGTRSSEMSRWLDPNGGKAIAAADCRRRGLRRREWRTFAIVRSRRLSRRRHGRSERGRRQVGAGMRQDAGRRTSAFLTWRRARPNLSSPARPRTSGPWPTRAALRGPAAIGSNSPMSTTN